MNYYYRPKASPVAIDLEALTKAYLAKGGTITKCQPGASEEVTLRDGRKQRSKPKPEDASGV